MKEYIITVAAAAIAAALADILAPKKWSGYIRLVIGFLILSVMLAPVAKFKDVEIFSSSPDYDISDEALKDKVSEELRKNVEKDIEERISDEFGVEAEATVEIEVDDEHNIKGVRAIKIKTWKKPDGLEERLKDVYGCNRIEFKFE